MNRHARKAAKERNYLSNRHSCQLRLKDDKRPSIASLVLRSTMRGKVLQSSLVLRKIGQSSISKINVYASGKINSCETRFSEAFRSRANLRLLTYFICFEVSYFNGNIVRFHLSKGNPSAYRTQKFLLNFTPLPNSLDYGL